MFTSIRNLRKSSAMTQRVNMVEAHLKRAYPGYNQDMMFPVFEVAASNSIDDYEWVQNNRQTHFTTPANLITASSSISKAGPARAVPKGEWLKSQTEAYVAAFTKAGITTGPWIEKHLAAADVAAAASEAPAPASEVPQQEQTDTVVDVAPAQASEVPAQASEAPTVEDKFVTAAMQGRIAAMVLLGTSKDKRSQMLEGLGIPFEKLLTILASSGELKASNADAVLSKGVK
jgi:hypothetical protein